jgi:uncharacterized protein (DUF433 family)
MIDWSQCPDVESVPDRCSGAWVVKGTRVMVEGILDNADECSPEEVADLFGLPVDVVRRILAFEEEARLQRAMQAGFEAVRGVFIEARSNLMRRLRDLPRDGSAERQRAKIITHLREIDRLSRR